MALLISYATHEFRLRDAKITVTAFKPKTVEDLATQINRG